MNVTTSMKDIYLAILCLAMTALISPLSSAEKSTDPRPESAVQFKWYGQSFVYLTSSEGVRVGIDPFDNRNSTYPIPEGLPVDVLLVSNERSDHNNTDFFAGSPLIFRSATGEGANRANNIIFTGIRAAQDESGGRYKGNSVIYTFKLSDISFAHLGALGQTKLEPSQLSQLEKVDVLFVPVGTGKFDRIISQIKPKIIIPIHYKTPFTLSALYPVDDFIASRKHRMMENEFKIRLSELPKDTEVWVPAPPAGPNK